MKVIQFPTDKVRKTERQIYNQNLDKIISEVREALIKETEEKVIAKFTSSQNS